uniref:HTH CENPB-type domain-containing protein n=1 Tax=Ditylenchus dipsaci TaxID=166011 RepID=A0A915CXX9_9BILA
MSDAIIFELPENVRDDSIMEQLCEVRRHFVTPTSFCVQDENSQQEAPSHYSGYEDANRRSFRAEKSYRSQQEARSENERISSETLKTKQWILQSSEFKASDGWFDGFKHSHLIVFKSHQEKRPSSILIHFPTYRKNVKRQRA